MTDINEAVVNSLNAIVASGKIEAIISQKLEKTIESILDDTLKSWSDFGKSLQTKVKESLQINLDKVDLPSYNDLVLKIIKKQVDAQIENAMLTNIEENMKGLFSLPPKEIKLSKLIEDFIEYSDEFDRDRSEKISLHIEPSSYGSKWIYIDPKGGKEKYRCKIHFGVSDKDNKIFGLRVDGEDFGKKLFIGSMSQLERDIFQLYAAGSTLIIDGESEDDFETHYPSAED